MSKKTFIRHQQMKHETLAAMLRVIKNGASCKRDIQSQSALSWGAVSENINLLQENQILVPSREELPGKAAAGRKSNRFEFNNRRFLCMGMDLQQRKIITSLVDLGGRVLSNSVYSTTQSTTPKRLRENVKAAFETQLRAYGLGPESVIAICFSLTGAVDCINCVWLKSPHMPKLHNYEFNAIREDYPGVKYFSVEHDIFARARAVQALYRWPENNFVFLHLDEGVGMAVHDHNGFLYGSRGLAGEIGHVPCSIPNNRIPVQRCSCGQDNCLETFLSTAGLLDFARKELRLNVRELPELFAAASSRQMEQLYEYLFPHLRNICITAVNIFDPTVLVIGGGIVDPWQKRLENDFFHSLQKVTWLNSPPELKSFRSADCNSAFGAALNTIDPVINIIAAGFT